MIKKSHFLEHFVKSKYKHSKIDPAAQIEYAHFTLQHFFLKITTAF